MMSLLYPKIRCLFKVLHPIPIGFANDYGYWYEFDGPYKLIIGEHRPINIHIRFGKFDHFFLCFDLIAKRVFYYAYDLNSEYGKMNEVDGELSWSEMESSLFEYLSTLHYILQSKRRP